MVEIIETVAENFQETTSKTQQISAAMQQTSVSVELINNQISNIDGEVGSMLVEQDQLLGLSKSLISLASSLEQMEKKYFFDLRLEDHKNWVATLKKAIDSKNPHVELALDHTLCKFGKWYFNYIPKSDEKFIFEKIDRPHCQIHETGRKIIEEMKKNDYHKAEMIFQNETLKLMNEIETLFISCTN